MTDKLKYFVSRGFFCVGLILFTSIIGWVPWLLQKMVDSGYMADDDAIVLISIIGLSSCIMLIQFISKHGFYLRKYRG